MNALLTASEKGATRGPKVLLVTHYYASHRAGVEIIAENIARRLAQNQNYEITWAASKGDVSQYEEEGVHVLAMAACNTAENLLGVPYPLWGPISLYRLWRAVRAARLVHLHDCLYMGNVCAFLFAKLGGKPVLVTQHIGLVPYTNAILRGAMAAANAVLGRFVLGRADRVVFYSQEVLRYFSEKVAFARPPLFIPNGVDTHLFRPPGETERARLRREMFGVGDETPCFLFVGRFVEKKGLGILRQLVERFPGIEWFFAGWGRLDPERWGVGNVRVFKGLDSRGLVPLYQAADLLVLPSVGEGLPLVVQEAMGCGLPVLVTPRTARADPEAEPFMFQEPGLEERGEGETVAGWAGRIEQFRQSPETMTGCRNTVRTFVEKHWSWDVCVRQYAEQIERLLTPAEQCA